MNGEEADFGVSELGTQKYWDDVYSRDQENFKQFGDEGEIWFGEEVERRLVNWFQANVSSESSVLDVGCGNAHLLIELFGAGFHSLCGIDYSPTAVILAAKIAHDRNASIRLQEVDFLKREHIMSLGRFDIIVDKGTLDAISLACDTTEDRMQHLSTYFQHVRQLLSPNGQVVITSCNWTEKELTSFASQCEFWKEYSELTFGRLYSVWSHISSSVQVWRVGWTDSYFVDHGSDLNRI